MALPFDKIQTDLIEALKAREELRVSVLRLLIAELKNQKISKMRELTDEDFVEVVRHEIKGRKESIEAYQKGGRQDLVDKETAELKILEEYMPEQMSVEELKKIVEATVAEVGVAGLPAGKAGMKDFGKVMGAVMGKVKGKTDGNAVSAVVRQVLS